MLQPYLHNHTKKSHQKGNLNPFHLRMELSHCLMAFLLQIIATQATISVGGGVAVGAGIGSGGVIGGGGVWIGSGGGGEVNTPSPSSSPSSSKQDNAYTAFQAWKATIKDDPLGILHSWVGSDVCVYKGVFCSTSKDTMGNPTGQVVVAIDLNHANLQGILVKELSLLTELSLLHLNSNRFSGSIPETFRDLSSLTEFDLSNNMFSGPFPTVTLLIPNLMYLDLRFNSFSGQLPQDLFNKKLDAIFINNNQFQGELPQNLGNSPASVINLANNMFSGDIPFSMSYMSPSIKEILFLNNQLTGCIPQGIGLWNNLQVLDVSSNSLMGHLPDSIACLSDIEVLNLAHNKFSGVLPDLVCSLRNILNLTVSYNFFSGFNQECDKLLYRNVFDFSLNCIPGRESQRPQPECSTIPGGSLNCLRIPSAKPIVCGSLVQEVYETRSPKTPSHN
ncbi:hypothetical protein LIER_24556 [Lithospermum erythrorhizon]|uniref:Cell wall hydroxyproline-rich glycoprotein n=1 Tax=Lithospermum erythrorhizon TaxID=34254 RepID=A0AAV3R586_LITER